MNHYLVVFDRSRGEVLRRQRYSDPNDALTARFAEERKHGGASNIEVVVLGATSWESVRRTHRRYFKDFDQLAAAAS